MALAHQGDAQQQAAKAENQQHGAKVVHLCLATLHRHVSERTANGPQGDQPQRQVDPEHPAPRQVLGQPAAQHWPGHAGRSVHAAEVALVAAAFAWGHEVANDCLAHRDHPACADTLQYPGQHQLRHVLGHGAGNGGQGEQADAGEDHPAPAVKVAQFAVDRHGHGHGHHITGDDPGQQADIAELRRDGGQRDGDDGLVQCAEEDGQHQGGEHVAQGGGGQGGGHGNTLFVYGGPFAGKPALTEALGL
ncbi:hypothetical protein D3C81_498390 [compost metagenome]